MTPQTDATAAAPTLSERSALYYSQAGVYRRFAECEDAPGKVARILLPHLAGQAVLDVGCGTGKYAQLFSGVARHYIGIDASSEALAIAEGGNGNTRARFLRAGAENLPIADNRADVALATWVFGTILEENRREQALRECLRVVRPGGRLFFVENDIGGEFEALRGRYPDAGRTTGYNRWLETRGFRPRARFASHFEFASRAEAVRVFGAIWGPKCAERVKSRRIAHRIVVYDLLSL